MLFDKPLIKGVNKTIGKYEFRSFQGAQWLKVFYHRPGDECVIFENEDQFMSINEKQRYSIYGELNEDFKINGKYEFLIDYPDISKFNWWRQSKLPYDDNEEAGVYTAEGYENVSISMTNVSWGGLVRQAIPYITEEQKCGSNCSFVEGSVGIENYYYAIGLRANHTTVPAADVWVPDVYLWIRIVGVNPSFLCTKLIYNQLHKLPFVPIFLLLS